MCNSSMQFLQQRPTEGRIAGNSEVMLAKIAHVTIALREKKYVIKLVQK